MKFGHYGSYGLSKVTAVLTVASILVVLSVGAVPLLDAYAQQQQGGDDTPKTIKIGALLQYTQENDDTANLRAIELSVNDINRDPTASTEYVVELIPIDITSYVSTGDARGLAMRVQSAITDDGLLYFVGPTTSAETGPVKDIADRIPGTVFVSPGSSAPVLPHPEGGVINLVEADGIFRLVPNETHQAERLTGLITENGIKKTIIIVRDQWEGIVNHLISDAFQPTVDRPLVTFRTAESFAGDESAAVAYHADIASSVNDRIGQILDTYNPDEVSIMFIGYPLDFEYHAKSIISSAAGLDNMYAVDWYGASTFIGEPATLRDPAVAQFADDVNLIGTRYTVEPNTVNQNLCNRLSEQDVACDRYATEVFASYDAVHLLVDSVIAQDERAADDDDGNDLTALELVLSVAAGNEQHHLTHEHRSIGDGALGAYSLNEAGDLVEPATYTPLRATAGGEWVPALTTPRICR